MDVQCFQRHCDLAMRGGRLAECWVELSALELYQVLRES